MTKIYLLILTTFILSIVSHAEDASHELLQKLAAEQKCFITFDADLLISGNDSDVRLDCGDGITGVMSEASYRALAEGGIQKVKESITNLVQKHNSPASICWFGDSQGASSGGIFDKLKQPILDAGHRFVTGRSICGARIQHHKTGNRTSTCNYKGQTYLSISQGRISFPRGRGQTLNVSGSISDCNTVVVQLGDNHLNDSSKSLRSAVESLALDILNQGKKCVWIGPAGVGPIPRCQSNNSKKLRVSQIIKSQLGVLKKRIGKSCTFIKSTSATPRGDSMCLHYGSQYHRWANAIENDVLNALD